MIRITRRQAIGGLAVLATLPATRLFAQGKLALPTSSVTLNVADVAGNLALTQKAIENYAAAKPNLVSKITFTKAPAPELPRVYGRSLRDADRHGRNVDLAIPRGFRAELQGSQGLERGSDGRSASRGARHCADAG